MHEFDELFSDLTRPKTASDEDVSARFSLKQLEKWKPEHTKDFKKLPWIARHSEAVGAATGAVGGAVLGGALGIRANNAELASVGIQLGGPLGMFAGLGLQHVATPKTVRMVKYKNQLEAMQQLQALIEKRRGGRRDPENKYEREAEALEGLYLAGSKNQAEDVQRKIQKLEKQLGKTAAYDLLGGVAKSLGDKAEAAGDALGRGISAHGKSTGSAIGEGIASHGQDAGRELVRGAIAETKDQASRGIARARKALGSGKGRAALVGAGVLAAGGMGAKAYKQHKRDARQERQTRALESLASKT